MSDIPHLSVAQQQWSFISCRYLPLHTRFISICKQFFKAPGKPHGEILRTEIRFPARVFLASTRPRHWTICMRSAASQFVGSRGGGRRVENQKMGNIHFGPCTRLASNPKHNNENAASSVFEAHGTNRNRERSVWNVFKSVVGGNSVVWKPLQLTVLVADFPQPFRCLLFVLGFWSSHSREKRVKNKKQKKNILCVCVVWCEWQKKKILDKSSASKN